MLTWKHGASSSDRELPRQAAGAHGGRHGHGIQPGTKVHHKHIYASEEDASYLLREPGAVMKI